MKRCSICKIVLPPELPCGLAPKTIIDEDGRIWGIFAGCPYEPAQPMQYVGLTDIGRMAKDEEAAAKKAARAVTAADYEALWVAGNGENYHVAFDAKARYRRWLSRRKGSVHKPHEGGKR
jgi:hypothetical protein